MSALSCFQISLYYQILVDITKILSYAQYFYTLKIISDKIGELYNIL